MSCESCDISLMSSLNYARFHSLTYACDDATWICLKFVLISSCWNQSNANACSSIRRSIAFSFESRKRINSTVNVFFLNNRLRKQMRFIFEILSILNDIVVELALMIRVIVKDWTIHQRIERRSKKKRWFTILLDKSKMQ